MSKYGLDEELEVEGKEDGIASFEEEKKKRRMFHFWEVGGVQYKLKLNTSMINALENKYKTNLMNIVASDELPSLSIMLTIIQGAMSPWNHKVDFKTVQKMYDQWTENGGNQIELYSKVLMPTLAVSGFFTESQAKTIMESLEEMDLLM